MKFTYKYITAIIKWCFGQLFEDFVTDNCSQAPFCGSWKYLFITHFHDIIYKE